MKTIATLCSGAGLVESGAVLAGLKPLWGVDNSPGAIEMHRLNFPNTELYDWDLTDVCNFSQLEAPDILHISPPCQQFSLANNKGGELSRDTKIAESFVKAVSQLNPKLVTLENVPAYRNSQSLVGWAK